MAAQVGRSEKIGAQILSLSQQVSESYRALNVDTAGLEYIAKQAADLARAAEIFTTTIPDDYLRKLYEFTRAMPKLDIALPTLKTALAEHISPFPEDVREPIKAATDAVIERESASEERRGQTDISMAVNLLSLLLVFLANQDAIAKTAHKDAVAAYQGFVWVVNALGALIRMLVERAVG